MIFEALSHYAWPRNVPAFGIARVETHINAARATGRSWQELLALAFAGLIILISCERSTLWTKVELVLLYPAHPCARPLRRVRPLWRVHCVAAFMWAAHCLKAPERTASKSCHAGHGLGCDMHLLTAAVYDIQFHPFHFSHRLIFSSLSYFGRLLWRSIFYVAALGVGHTYRPPVGRLHLATPLAGVERFTGRCGVTEGRGEADAGYGPG